MGLLMLEKTVKPFCATASSAGEEFVPGRLWSLWEMLKHRADSFLQLGRNIEAAFAAFGSVETMAEIDQKPVGPLEDDERANLTSNLRYLHINCKRMGLKVSSKILEDRIQNLPQSYRELGILVDVVMTELKEELFLFVPSHRAKYFELVLQSTVTTAFPSSSKELVSAGNCLAAGLYTAAVFHSMRAAEIGVRILGGELGVTFPDKPIELAEWQNILDQCDSKIVAMKALPRGTHKDEYLNFNSQAAVQFRYFKDAWRVRVAHARETYDESQAIKVFTHTSEFFDTLSSRLKEPKPSDDGAI
jgi:hypothetical protein